MIVVVCLNDNKNLQTKYLQLREKLLHICLTQKLEIESLIGPGMHMCCVVFGFEERPGKIF